MEIIGLLLVLGVLGVMAYGVIGGAALVGMGSADKKKQAEETDSLESTFDGREQVVWETGVVGLRPAEVIKAADARGYNLVSQSDSRWSATLVFRKRESGASS